MQKNYHKNKAGFTLIEVLIASLIFVVVITVTTSVFVVNSTVGDKARTIRELSQSARYGLESMAREARNSEKMSADGQELIITSKDKTVGINGIKTYNLKGNKIMVDGNPLFPDNVIVEKPEDWSVQNIASDVNPGINDQDYPLIQIYMKLSYKLGDAAKKSTSYTETFQTSITNRSYPIADFQGGQ